MAFEGMGLYLSGGSGNTSIAQSLGGAISTASGGFWSPQQAVWDPIPGLTIESVWGAPVGSGTLEFQYPAGLVVWTPASGPVTTMRVGSDGLYVVGSPPARMLFTIVSSLMPQVTTSKALNILNQQGNIFDNTSPAERLVGDVEYRCLWVKNHGSIPATDVVLEIISNATHSTIHLGSEFYSGYSPYLTMQDAERYAIAYRETAVDYAVGPVNAQDTDDYFIDGASFRPSEYGSTGQDSDGTSGVLPFVLADEDDSTGLLGGVTWANYINWGTIPAGKARSFWLKRTITMDGGSPRYDEDCRLKLTFSGD